MNKKTVWTIIVIVIILVIIGIAVSKSNTSAPATTNIPPVTQPVATSTPAETGTSTGATAADYSDLIIATNPKPNQLITSPLVITGKARGTWFFEATFPAVLLDANGKEIARMPIRAEGEWMTNEFVPFKTTFTFAKPATKTGTLVLKKDNP
ncbi:MAG: hypothetical protein JWO73_668, partial [Candidatus Taylorbacteria bacterium]|nr:hypothetical protein [Candidatus Taylorbacteria bacterium]